MTLQPLAGPTPTAFTARTRTSYPAPFVNPVSDNVRRAMFDVHAPHDPADDGFTEYS